MSGSIKPEWNTDFEIRSYDVDTSSRARLSVFCQFMQEGAYLHAEHLGLGHKTLSQQNLAWVLARMRLDIKRLPQWGERITLRTWPSGRDRLFYHRDFEFKDSAGQAILLASTAWFVIDFKKRERVIPDWWSSSDFPVSEPVFETKLGRLKGCGCGNGDALSVNYGDLDQNGHVSNIRYVEWIMNNLPLDFHQTRRIHSLEANFLSEAVYGHDISIFTNQDGYTLSHGIQCEGQELFRAQTIWTENEN